MPEDSVALLLKGRKVVMVCQAASQTRFRALKHENGIAGSATIIVRVIACFQPLQDCQVSRICFLHDSRLLFLCLGYGYAWPVYLINFIGYLYVLSFS